MRRPRLLYQMELAFSVSCPSEILTRAPLEPQNQQEAISSRTRLRHSNHCVRCGREIVRRAHVCRKCRQAAEYDNHNCPACGAPPAAQPVDDIIVSVGCGFCGAPPSRRQDEEEPILYELACRVTQVRSAIEDAD